MTKLSGPLMQLFSVWGSRIISAGGHRACTRDSAPPQISENFKNTPPIFLPIKGSVSSLSPTSGSHRSECSEIWNILYKQYQGVNTEVLNSHRPQSMVPQDILFLSQMCQSLDCCLPFPVWSGLSPHLLMVGWPVAQTWSLFQVH